MRGPWFRLYDEVADDPKVQSLPAEDFKGWINLLCIANRNDGRLPSIEAIAFGLRMDVIGARSLVDRLAIGGLIDKVKGGPIGWYIAPHAWDKRQYKSDTSTERVKRFRNATKTVTVTPSEAETESESDSSSSFHSEEEHGVLAKPKKPTVSESHTAAFEEFWKLYPKSIDRSASLKAWMRNVKPADVPEVMRALKLYVARMAGKEIQFVKRGATFVNSGWREELALAAKAPVVGAIQRSLITEEPPTPPDLLEIRQKRYAAVEARAAELRAEAEASQK